MNFHSVPFVIALVLDAIITFASAASGAAAYSSGTLKKDCECESSYFTFADMENVSEKVKLSTGKALGKYCEVKDDKAICKVERENKQETGGFVCPLECVTLTPTQPLTGKEKKSLLEKAIVETKQAYRVKVPKPALDAFEKKFPAWIPPIMREGDFQDYEPRYRLLESSVLYAPVSYSSDGKQKNEWFAVLIFYPDLKTAEAQILSWAFISLSSGKVLRAESLSWCNKSTGWPYEIKPRIQFMPTSPVMTALYCAALGPSDAAGAYEAILTDVASAQTAPSFDPNAYPRPSELQKNPPQWLDSIWDDLKERESTVALIDGPANIRTKPSTQAKAVGECKDNTLAVVRPFKDAPPWIVMAPPAKKSPPSWGYVYCDGKEGWTSAKNLKPYPSRP